MPIVSGRVTDHAGAGVAGVYVSALPAEGGRFGRAPGTHTDLTGRWRLELAAGQWTVRETGGNAHEIVVGATAVTVEQTITAQSQPPTREELQRRMSRRRERRTALKEN